MLKRVSATVLIILVGVSGCIRSADQLGNDFHLAALNQCADPSSTNENAIETFGKLGFRQKELNTLTQASKDAVIADYLMKEAIKSSVFGGEVFTEPKMFKYYITKERQGLAFQDVIGFFADYVKGSKPPQVVMEHDEGYLVMLHARLGRDVMTTKKRDALTRYCSVMSWDRALPRQALKVPFNTGIQERFAYEIGQAELDFITRQTMNTYTLARTTPRYARLLDDPGTRVVWSFNAYTHQPIEPGN